MKSHKIKIGIILITILGLILIKTEGQDIVITEEYVEGYVIHTTWVSWQKNQEDYYEYDTGISFCGKDNLYLVDNQIKCNAGTGYSIPIEGIGNRDELADVEVFSSSGWFDIDENGSKIPVLQKFFIENNTICRDLMVCFTFPITPTQPHYEYINPSQNFEGYGYRIREREEISFKFSYTIDFCDTLENVSYAYRDARFDIMQPVKCEGISSTFILKGETPGTEWNSENSPKFFDLFETTENTTKIPLLSTWDAATKTLCNSNGCWLFPISSVEPATTPITTITNTGSSLNTSDWFFVIYILLVVVVIYLYFKLIKDDGKTNNPNKGKAKAVIEIKEIEKFKVNLEYISQRRCCRLHGRLGDIYCDICGRAIPKEWIVEK